MALSSSIHLTNSICRIESSKMLVSEQGIPEGQYTQIVYTALKEERYHDAIQILSIELQKF